MDYRLNIDDLSNPKDLNQLKRAISEIADECDTLYTETAPNGTIASRLGRRAIYNDGVSYTTWVNTDGGTTWQRLQPYDQYIISITTPARGAIPIYSSGGWIGYTPTTATNGQFIQSQGWGADPIYSKVNLASSSQVTGDLPVANLNGGSGATANTFWCGDGTWKQPLFQNIQVFTSSGTWTRPSGVDKVYVKMWGAGGGGSDDGGGGQGGGGGGAYLEGITAVTGNVSVTVGQGGVNGNPSTNGGDSIFPGTTTLTAGGGKLTNNRTGGAGGTATNGLINLQGQPGSLEAANNDLGGLSGGPQMQYSTIAPVNTTLIARYIGQGGAGGSLKSGGNGMVIVYY